MSLQSHQRGKPPGRLGHFCQPNRTNFLDSNLKNRNFYSNLLEIAVPLLEVLLFFLDCCAVRRNESLKVQATISETANFPVGQNCWHRLSELSVTGENSLGQMQFPFGDILVAQVSRSHRRTVTYAPSVDTTVQSASTLVPHHELHRNQRRNGGGEGGFKRPWYRKFVKVTASMSGEILLDSRDGGL